MQSAGALTGKGMQLITTEVNKALGLFGANKLPIPEAVSWAQFQSTGAAGGGQNAPGHRATGGMMVNHPTYIVGEEAPTHPEYVLATNPAYRDRNVMLWAQAAKALGIPGFAAGGVPSASAANAATGAGGAGYVYPFPPGTVLGRVDEGRDADMPVGAPIGAIGPAVVTQILQNWFQGQPIMTERLLSGPAAGRYVYLAEQITDLAAPGTHLTGNQAMARFASSGTGIEMGWGSASGQPAAHGIYSEGDVTADGTSFANFIAGLAHGQINAGALGAAGSFSSGSLAAMFTALTSPKVKGGGAIGTLINALLRKVTNAANAYGAAHGTSGGSSFSGNVKLGSGSAAAQIGHFLESHGFNKIGAAGILGNFAQESGGATLAGITPTSAGSGGEGIAGWTPASELTAFASAHGQPWTSLALQMEALMTGIGGLTPLGSVAGSMNSQPNASAAADWFMNNWEHPALATENAAGREAAARQAFAMGLARGGIMGYAGGGVVGAAESAGSAASKTGPGYNFIKNPSNAQYQILRDKNLTGHQKAVALAYLAGHGGSVGTSSGVPKNFPKKGKKAPKTPPPKLHLYGTGGGFLGGAGAGDDMDAIGSSIKWMNEMQNKKIPYLSGEYGYIQDQNSNMFGNANLVVTQDAQGNPVTPFIDWATVNADLGQLQDMYGIESTIRADYEQMNAVVGPLIKAIQRAIAKRKALIAKAKHQIAINVKALKFLTHQLGLKGITNKQKGMLNAQISSIHKGNSVLGGNATSLGTGGQIGAWSKQVGELNTDLGNMKAYLPGGGSELYGQFPLDPNSAIGGATQTLETLGTQIGALSPTALADSLAQAQSSAGTSNNSSELISLLQQQLATSSEALYVSQQQYGVLQNLPPFGGSFAAGGMVPGPPGAARTVIAHGGEFISPNGGSQELHIHGLGDFVDRVESVVNGKRKEISTWVDHDLGAHNRARRMLPSARPLAVR